MSEQYNYDERAAEDTAQVLNAPELTGWLDQIRDAEEDVLSFQKKMALVEAPTFEEAERAGRIKELFQQMGLSGVTVDDLGNTWGTLPGAAEGSCECACVAEGSCECDGAVEGPGETGGCIADGFYGAGGCADEFGGAGCPAGGFDFAGRFGQAGCPATERFSGAGYCAADGFGEAGGCIVIEAHMDTVFPKGTAVEVKERDGILYCPGISDNTRGLAVLYGLLRAFQTAGVKTEKSIVFLATVREEGVGGCSGLKHFLENHDHIDACISVDGPDSNVIIHGGPGIKTIEVRFYGNGGHAYKDFGRKGNPVHAAIRAMEKIVGLPLPTEPRTTCVISRFEAGTAEGIHAIPAEAMLTLNFRSESAAQLMELEQAIMKALEAGAAAENTFTGGDDIRFEIVRLVDIPAVRVPDSSPIVRSMAVVMERLGLEPVFDGNCPTNASVAMGRGIPSICIGGGGTAGDNHSLLEWYDPRDSYKAVQGAFLELLILAGLKR